jgi:hypothetical protein
MAEETVILVPWGDDGWAYIALSDGYQPEHFVRGITPVDADRPFRVMYWTKWDGTAAYTHGYDPRQVRLQKTDEHRFEMTFDRIHQPWQDPDSGTIEFSDDGTRMTETRNGHTLSNWPTDGITAYDTDVRIYEKISPADWPGDVRIDFSAQQ